MKPIFEYYRHSQMGDGHLNKCKGCCKKQSNERYKQKTNDPDWVESEKLRGRLKAKKYKYRTNTISRSKASKKYYSLNKVKINASNCVSRNIGGRDGQEAHHWSYNKKHWLDVFWLSPSFHGFIHRFLEYDEYAKMYRHYDTKELLNTRTKHKEFMDSLIDEYESEMKLVVNQIYIPQIQTL